MLFNSLHFLIFFPIITVLHFLLPHRLRWQLLLIASAYFYMSFRPVYILILACSIFIDYTAAILIERAEGRRRKLFLLVSIFANIGLLVFFKYYNFLNQSLSRLLYLLGLTVPVPPLLNVLLPIGLSFHIFQSLSYTIEVYRGQYKAERHLGLLALYVMFYPQLVAGPIERPQNLLPQFRDEQHFNYERVISGLQLMLWGFFKKIVIADRLALLVDAVYLDPHSYHGISFIVATVFFAFQLYCDFSGYSDIARGSAQVMGFRLMRNFDRPFLSENLSVFWRRWHISLSSWFRDYVFFSLPGKRIKWRFYFNLFLIFLLSGLWHGAKWTFVAWGMLNGCYLVLGGLWQGAAGNRVWSSGLHTWMRQLIYTARVLRTFALFSFSLIFFRANSLTDAFYIISHLFDGLGTMQLDSQAVRMFILLRAGALDFVVTLMVLVLLLAVEILQSRYHLKGQLARQRVWLRWSLYYACIVVIFISATLNEPQKFIYSQF